MSKVRYLIVFIFFLFHYTSNAQVGRFVKDMRDSIRFYKEHTKPRLLLGFDNNITFLGSQSVRVNGLKLGMNYKKFHYFLGLHGTPNPITEVDLINQQQSIPDTLFKSLQFNFATLGFTYTHWATKHWYFESTAQIGIGSGERFEQFNSQVSRRTIIPIYPASIDSKAFYMITSWVGAGTGLGMRKALNSRSQFDGLFYSLSARFLLGEFYRKVIRKNKGKNK